MSQTVFTPQTLDTHAAESAQFVREAILEFPRNDAALQETGTGPFATVENFMDVWHMEKNAAKRPEFLRAIADDETLDALLSYLRSHDTSNAGLSATKETKEKEESESASTLSLRNCSPPSVLARVSLDVLNRLFKERSVGRDLIVANAKRFHDVVSAVTVAARASAHPNNRLMCLETVTTLAKHSEYEQLCPALIETNFWDVAMESVAWQDKPARVTSGESERDIQVYTEICGMLSTRLLSRLCLSPKASPEFISKHGAALLSNLLTVIANKENWAERSVLDSHAQYLISFKSAAPAVWETEFNARNGADGRIVRVFRAAAVKGWADSAKLFRLLGNEHVQHCFSCGKIDCKLMVCSRCKAAFYCQRQCQQNDWKEHKKTCVGTPGAELPPKPKEDDAR